MTHDEKVIQIAQKLLLSVDDDNDCELIRLDGGKNNRVYKIQTSSAAYLLKSYFSHPDDLRDRLGTEFAFLSYANACSISSVPKAIAKDEESKTALYSFITGNKMLQDEIGANHVQQCVAFIIELNHGRNDLTVQINQASEACFSMGEHLRVIDHRISQLEKMPTGDALDSEALELVQHLRSEYNRIVVGLDGATGVLSRNNQILSPSDFGFHNILNAQGKLFFLDFEYAGWDDPAKLICDFFSQPTIQVSMNYWNEMLGALETLVEEPAVLASRAKALLPLYRIKWCCIILSDFLVPSRKRREFAMRDELPDRKAKQLQKAKRYFHAFINQKA